MFHEFHMTSMGYCISLNVIKCMNGEVDCYAHDWHDIFYVTNLINDWIVLSNILFMVDVINYVLMLIN